MSGIYIPGISMPKDGECVVVSSDGTAYKYKPGDVVMYGDAYNEMADVIELLPHGRLGDLDALIDVIERTDWFHQAPNKEMVLGANSAEHQAWYKEQDVYNAVENADTIIPADPEKEDA